MRLSKRPFGRVSGERVKPSEAKVILTGERAPRSSAQPPEQRRAKVTLRPQAEEVENTNVLGPTEH